MTNDTLVRVSTQYRDGYRHAEAGIPHRAREFDLSRPFGHTDYDSGYEAGLNDLHWRLVYAGQACDIKTRRCGL